MLSPVYIGNLLVFWTRFAKSEANVRVEVHAPQELAAVEPIIVSTCCRFESCDIQILLEGFGIAAIIQRLRGLLHTLLIGIGRRYSTGDTALRAMGFSRLYSTGSLQVICV